MARKLFVPRRIEKLAKKIRARDSKIAADKIRKATTAAPKSKGFTSLPAELQEKIFGHVFSGKEAELHELFAQNNATGETKILPSLPELAVSRDWYNNAVHSFWTNVNFVSTLVPGYLEPCQLEKMTSITFDGMPTEEWIGGALAACPNLESLTIRNIKDADPNSIEEVDAQMPLADLRSELPWIENVVLAHPKLRHVTLRTAPRDEKKPTSHAAIFRSMQFRRVVQQMEAYIYIRLGMKRSLEEYAEEPVLFLQDFEGFKGRNVVQKGAVMKVLAMMLVEQGLKAKLGGLREKEGENFEALLKVLREARREVLEVEEAVMEEEGVL